MSHVTIYHNPRCSKSRQTLALVEEHGIEPDIVKYLETPPSEAQLAEILDLLGVEPQDLMRKHEQAYKDAGLDDETLSRAEQIRRMVQFPKVIERPIVIVGDQAVIGRPPENVLKILKG